MKLFELYNARNMARNGVKNGSAEKRRQQSRSYTIRKFEDAPSYFELNGIPTSSNGIDKEIYRMRLINESFIKQLNPARTYAKYGLLHPEDSIQEGVILRDIDGSSWLVNAVSSISQVISQLMMLRMQTTLFWRIEDLPLDFSLTREELNEFFSDGLVFNQEAPYFGIPVFANPVSEVGDGLNKTQVAYVQDELTELKLPINNFTKAFYPGMPIFIKGEKPYKIEKIDDYSTPNTISMICKRDAIEDRDKPFLGKMRVVKQAEEEETTPTTEGKSTLGFNKPLPASVYKGDSFTRTLVLPENTILSNIFISKGNVELVEISKNIYNFTIGENTEAIELDIVLLNTISGEELAQLYTYTIPYLKAY